MESKPLAKMIDMSIYNYNKEREKAEIDWMKNNWTRDTCWFQL